MSQTGSGLKLQTSAETNGDEYIRLETSTYECLEVRRRAHTTGDEYIRQETSTYKYIQVDISRYQYPKAGDQVYTSG